MKDLLITRCLGSNRIAKIKREFSSYNYLDSDDSEEIDSEVTPINHILRDGKIHLTEALNYYYDYDKDNGRLYYKNSSYGVVKGSEVGYVDKQRHVHRMHIKDYCMLTCSVIWFIEHGRIQDYCLGYRDGDKANTRIDNLFETNRRIRKNTLILLRRLV